LSTDEIQPLLEPTGERLHPEIFGEVRQEHVHRYKWCLESVRGKDVLDVASGEGYGSAIIAAVARSVIGVDISEAAVAHANKRYQRDNLSFTHGQIENLPLASNCVDVVVSFETIEHLVDQELAIEEIHRVLRPDGILIMSTPNIDIYTNKQDHHNPFHMRELSKSDFESLISKHFPAFRIFSQRLAVGSIMLPDEGLDIDSKADIFIDDGNLSLSGNNIPDMMYYIAVAGKKLSDLPIFSPSVLLSSAYDVYWSTRMHVENLQNDISQNHLQHHLQQDEVKNLLAQLSVVNTQSTVKDSQLAALASKANALSSKLAEQSLDLLVLSSGLFDTDYYGTVSSQSGFSAAELVSHYLSVGEKLGFRPSEAFDPAFYAQTNPDVVAAGFGMLVHYIVNGQWEGRLPVAPRLGAEV